MTQSFGDDGRTPRQEQPNPLESASQWSSGEFPGREFEGPRAASSVYSQDFDGTRRNPSPAPSSVYSQDQGEFRQTAGSASGSVHSEYGDLNRGDLSIQNPDVMVRELVEMFENVNPWRTSPTTDPVRTSNASTDSMEITPLPPVGGVTTSRPASLSNASTDSMAITPAPPLPPVGGVTTSRPASVAGERSVRGSQEIEPGTLERGQDGSTTPTRTSPPTMWSSFKATLGEEHGREAAAVVLANSIDAGARLPGFSALLPVAATAAVSALTYDNVYKPLVEEGRKAWVGDPANPADKARAGRAMLDGIFAASIPVMTVMSTLSINAKNDENIFANERQFQNSGIPAWIGGAAVMGSAVMHLRDLAQNSPEGLTPGQIPLAGIMDPATRTRTLFAASLMLMAQGRLDMVAGLMTAAVVAEAVADSLNSKAFPQLGNLWNQKKVKVAELAAGVADIGSRSTQAAAVGQMINGLHKVEQDTIAFARDNVRDAGMINTFAAGLAAVNLGLTSVQHYHEQQRQYRQDQQQIQLQSSAANLSLGGKQVQRETSPSADERSRQDQKFIAAVARSTSGDREVVRTPRGSGERGEGSSTRPNQTSGTTVAPVKKRA